MVAIDTEISAALARHDYPRYVIGRLLRQYTRKSTVLAARIAVNNTFRTGFFKQILNPFDAVIYFLFAI